MAGADPRSIAHSRFWTLFPFLAALAFCVILWGVDYPWFWWLVSPPAAFFVGVAIRRNRGMAKARRLAMADPLAFMHLWDEGALSLTVQDTVCMSPNDDYQKFVAQYFLWNSN